MPVVLRARIGSQIVHRAISPAFLQPMTTKVVQALPEGPEWLYEVKLDGYRALLLKDGERIHLRSRNEKTLFYPEVEATAKRLNARSVTLDGEIVAVDTQGHPSFQALQHRSAHPKHVVVFYAFDVLHLDGDDLTRLPLTERRKRLPAVVQGSRILISQELRGTAPQVITAVQRLGLEGIIAKRRDSRYEAGKRSGAWVKLKLDKQQEFVVGGYRPGNHGVDALLVGYYEGKALKFGGKVRAGFTPHVRRDVYAALKPVHTAKCPFVDLPNSKTSRWGAGVTAEEMNEMKWVKPRLVAQVRFVEWTAEGHLRHAAFLGLRADKSTDRQTRGVNLAPYKRRRAPERTVTNLSCRFRSARTGNPTAVANPSP
jgi:DNA ligase D-like protein (predicted ligase)